ncbi:MAG: hypothetical protein HY735_21560 [Verrucomicrobia bacterium]|nr:hypothetical protein [Verrucomicrobiota bacterium]
MNVQFHINGFKADGQLRRQLEADLERLNQAIPVACANVVLERQRDTNPPFEAVVLLSVPGPDLHAAARDHTWPAAWIKVLTRVREQFETRRYSQASRRKNEPRIHSPARYRKGAKEAQSS